jgi:hypothetical protein
MIEETQSKCTEDIAYLEKIMQRAFKKQTDDLEIRNIVTSMTDKLAAQEQQ